MAILRGWQTQNGVDARGQFYSRYANRYAPHTRENTEWVSKHSGEVYHDVRWNPRSKSWEGVGYITTEPRHVNLSGSDKGITTSPSLRGVKVKKVVIRPIRIGGRMQGRKVIVFRKPVKVF